MKAVIIGGDERFAHAARKLAEMGYEAQRLDRWPDYRPDIALVQSEEQIIGDDYGLCFVQRGSGMQKKTVYMEKNEQYLSANAFLTAEGALRMAMGAEGRALFGMNCLVVGYGRIGRALCGMLRSMGAQVSAAVRPGKSADRAKMDGVPCVLVSTLKTAIGEFDYIWNTVPERIIGRDTLERMKKGAGLFDLASQPYGFDIEEARSLDLWAERLPGLPGKYCPATAGEVLAAAIDRIRKEETEWNRF